MKNDSIIKSGTFLWSPRWFLLIRLFGVVAVAWAIFMSYSIFDIQTPHYFALWILSALLLMTNILYFTYCRASYLSEDSKDPNIFRRLQIFTIFQINSDLIILTFLLHYSGGATNPFILYYFFHVILSSILLSKTTAYMEACCATLMFNTMAILEGLGIVPHYTIFSTEVHSNVTFILGICFAFTSAIFLAVYMATSVVERLRQHERELEVALEEKARLEEEKARFLDIVVHDLKGPLASIETMVTSSLAVYGNEIPPKVKNIIERIPARTQSLLRFIKELLDFSQMQNTKHQHMVFETVNFNEVVAVSVDMQLNTASNKNIDISLIPASHPLTISGNMTLLEHMVTNLVSNAIQYTPENGSVSITVSSEKDDIVLRVADTGIGIPEKDIPNIFNDFFRAVNSRKFSSSGSGLGLSITREIAENHGGSISFTTQEGEGTVFTVRLPSDTCTINAGE
jgi:two-component system, OmpR family, phosphate regulon sensor histidine kinase PhoR